jgi:hypothetical protein
MNSDELNAILERHMDTSQASDTDLNPHTPSSRNYSLNNELYNAFGFRIRLQADNNLALVRLFNQHLISITDGCIIGRWCKCS